MKSIRYIFLVSLLSDCLPAVSPYPTPFAGGGNLNGEPAGQFFNPFRGHPVPRKTLRGRLCHLVSADDAGAG